MTSVSIITPVYNVEIEMWERSQKSIIAQTNKDFEWILISDGDQEALYNSKYGLTYKADVAIDKNFGPSVARNVGFQISSGEIITYLDMGDELDPRRVENIIKLFNNYPVELTFSDYGISESHPNVYRFSHFDFIGKHQRFPDAAAYIRLLQYQNISIPMGVAHRRKPFVEVGGFQRGIVCGEDGILWRRMVDKIESSRIMFSDDYAGLYHVSQAGQSRTQRRFEMGGFAFDGDLRDNGRYLDEQWYKEYSSEGYYE